MIGRDLAGADLSHDALTYVFDRVTGDDPFARSPYGVDTLLDDPSDRGDAEARIQRIVFAPATRSYSVGAWVYPAGSAADSALDRLAGYRGADTFDSSGRFQNQPAYRASSAFTRRSPSGWVGFWNGAQAPAPWISWSTPSPHSLGRLRISGSPLAVRHPTAVRLSWPGGRTAVLPVAPSGEVVLPRAARAASFRLTVVAAAFAPGATARQRRARAVGIGRLSVPGLPAPLIPASGRLHAACGVAAVDVGGRRVELSVAGTVSALDSGLPLRARGCGGHGPSGSASVTMAAGVERIASLPGIFSVDLLRLASAAPKGAPAAAVAAAGSPGRVIAPGAIGNSAVTGVRVALHRPAWLVLGEAFDIGWRATCDGRALGSPHVIDGYANGWLAPASCKRVSFSFAPQAGVRTSYLVSAVTGALLVALLLFGARRSPARDSLPARARPRKGTPSPSPPARSLPRAAALGFAAAIPLGYLFAIRAGAGLFLLVTFVLWRGYSPRTLAYAAAALLGVVVPAMYLIGSPHNQGGYGFAYATQLIGAHWVGVAAIVLIAISVWQLILAARR